MRRGPHPAPRAPAGRALLFTLAALAGGVLLWIAIEALLERRQVPLEQQADIDRQSAENLEAMQQSLAESLAGSATSAAQERMDSPRGQALARLCTEWMEFHENHPNDETARRRDEACGRFKAWVDDGVQPAEQQ
ncbi:MAG TPA: hypothetical protein VFY03_08225 [Woeseiaceae bacterium]|nr:hypothetical protein [Woeseiaceae bacterium]